MTGAAIVDLANVRGARGPAADDGEDALSDRWEGYVARVRRDIAAAGPTKFAAQAKALVAALPHPMSLQLVAGLVKREAELTPPIPTEDTEEFVAGMMEPGADHGMVVASVIVEALPVPLRHRLLLELVRLYCVRSAVL